MRRRSTSRSTASLRSSAIGFVEHIETHETRGNAGAVVEAEAELDRTLDELEVADGVRPVDYAIGKLSDLGPTPVDQVAVDALRRKVDARRTVKGRRR